MPDLRRKYMAMQQIILIYPIFDHFMSFHFSFEKSYRENRLKALQLTGASFLQQGKLPPPLKS